MKEKCLFLVLLFFSYCSLAQDVINFDSKKIPSKWDYSQSGVEIFSGDESQNNHCLIMAGPGVWLKSPELEYPGQIEFNYKSVIPAIEIGFSFVTEYFSRAKNDWVQIDVITPTYQQALFFLKTIKIPEEATSIRFKINSYNGGNILIDNIKIIPMNGNQITSLEIDKREKKISEQIMQNLKTASKQEEFSQVSKAIGVVEANYLNHLELMQKIYDKTSGIYITQKTGELIFKRSEMANPLSYSEFKKWLNSLKSLSDNVLLNYLKDLEKQFEQQKQSYERQRQVFGRITKGVNMAINIGNIVTAGKLTSIINSFKGIFATCYSKSNLETIYPIYSEMKISVDGKKRRTDEVSVLVRNTNNVKKIDSLVRFGVNEYNKLSAFFEIIENENVILSNQSNLWRETNTETNNFRKEMFTFVKQYIQEATLDSSLVTNNLVEKFLNEDAKACKDIENYIKQYFKTFLGDKSDFVGFSEQKQEQIDRIRYKIRATEQKTEGYFKVANKFLGLYQNMEIDLNRNNPFSEFENQYKMNCFADAIASWDAIRVSALPLVSELKTEIKNRYVDVVF